jgi:hypothetical protein
MSLGHQIAVWWILVPSLSGLAFSSEKGDQDSRPALEEAAKSDKPLVKCAATAALKRVDAAKAQRPSP